MPPRDQVTETDARILAVLQRDGRRPYADVGTEVGLSGPSAYERIKRLEARGVISGYAAQVDPLSVGLGVTAFTWITQAPGTVMGDLTGEFEAIPEIEECHRVAGQNDYLLKIRAHDTRDLERIVQRIRNVRHVFTTDTEIVFSTAFERRPFVVRRETEADAEP